MRNKLVYAALFGLIAAPAFAETDMFVKDQALNQWRASKLVGVNVMGPDQKKIGSIQDILVDHDGTAQTVVIGVGGFLGIGEKNVAVPFKSVKWRTEARAAAMTGATPPGNTTSSSSAPAAKTDPAAIEASQGYPDMAMLDMTKQQLQNAPDFTYVASPNTAASPPSQSDTGAMKPAKP